MRVRAEPASLLYMCHRRFFFFQHHTKIVCFSWLVMRLMTNSWVISYIQTLVGRAGRAGRHGRLGRVHGLGWAGQLVWLVGLDGLSYYYNYYYHYLCRYLKDRLPEGMAT